MLFTVSRTFYTPVLCARESARGFQFHNKHILADAAAHILADGFLPVRGEHVEAAVLRDVAARAVPEVVALLLVIRHSVWFGASTVRCQFINCGLLFLRDQLSQHPPHGTQSMARLRRENTIVYKCG